MDLKTIISNLKKRYPFHKILKCRDFGTFYVFDIRHINADSRVDIGSWFYAVDKETGKEYEYDIMSHPDLYLKSKIVKI